MVVSSSSSSLPLNTMVHMLTIKMTSSNYLLWRNQFIPLLTSQDLFGYLDGSVRAPSPKVTSSDGTTQVNLAYTSWLNTDQTLLSLLYSSLTEESMSELPLPSFADIVPKALSHEIFERSVSQQSTTLAFYAQQNSSSTRLKNTKKGKPKPFSTSASKSSTSSPIYCQLCDKEGHLAKRCWTFLNLKKKQSANLAEAFAACLISDSNDSNWYPDSGATSHMTHDPEGVDVPAIYSGNERVMVGNGSGHKSCAGSRQM
ncbi:hypothetical protein Acr_17g0010240 [Actinidia rufa]|uniref:Retrotransposon Copia-like N-terminal domain-containing protein n=1 Tax=Actinidia rufa TaxID=165716 RepID=A0A7J0G3W4_9ERIC|nr:hypothetical protein Acr_17g0010240 [Actinidia rufa]